MPLKDKEEETNYAIITELSQICPGPTETINELKKLHPQRFC